MFPQNIRIVLVNTSHPGNIGAVARAMKNMELSRLYLVSPRFFPHAEATARAAGADDILNNATVTSTLLEAIIDCELVIGTSARERALPIPILNPREASAKVFQEAALEREVAMVFGAENFGLLNEELQLCHYHLHVPTNNTFSSLNLAAAVLLVAYEIKMAFARILQTKEMEKAPIGNLAPILDVELLYEHLAKTLIKIEFLNPDNPRHLMERIRRMFGRIRLEQSEVNILRGILTAIDSEINK